MPAEGNKDYRVPEGFLLLKQAQESLGISKKKAWPLAKEGLLLTYSLPMNSRFKLVKVEDLARLRPHVVSIRCTEMSQQMSYPGS